MHRLDILVNSFGGFTNFCIFCTAVSVESFFGKNRPCDFHSLNIHQQKQSSVTYMFFDVVNIIMRVGSHIEGNLRNVIYCILHLAQVNLKSYSMPA